MARNKWPFKGTIDWVTGPSKLDVENSPTDMVLNGSYKAIKDEAERVNAGLTQAMINYCIYGPPKPEADDPTAATERVLTGGSSAKGEAIVAEARKHLGKPYKWGAQGPDKFDCSGLVLYCYKKAAHFTVKTAHSSGRRTRGMYASSQGDVIHDGQMSPKEMLDLPAPGDIILFGSPVHHVGICIGGKTGKFIHAPQTGDVVKISRLADRRDHARLKRYFPLETDGVNDIDGVPTNIPDKHKALVAKYAKKYDIPASYICAVIKHESGWDEDAVGKNTNGTWDWGLAQINDGGDHSKGPTLLKPSVSIKKCARHIRSDADYIVDHSALKEDWSHEWVMNLYRAYNAGKGGWSRNPGGLPERGESVWNKFQNYLKKVPKSPSTSTPPHSTEPNSTVPPRGNYVA